MNFRLFLLVFLLAPGLDQARAQNDAAATHPAYWGAPSVDGGKCCASLVEVRDNIDRLDRQIIALMAERGKYVAEAGRFKADPAAVSAPARVEAIIAKVKTIARRRRPRGKRRRTQLSRDDRRVRGLRAGGMDAPQRGRGARRRSERAGEPAVSAADPPQSATLVTPRGSRSRPSRAL